ncbi:MAG: trypsin-like peptidase domain-containing protein [Thermoguttaceae bacterium]
MSLLYCVLLSFLHVDPSAVMERAVPSVVAIYPADESEEAAGGSGVIVSSDGDVVTNFHVVQPCGAFLKCGLADGQIFDAVVVGLDPAGDLALVKIVSPSPMASPVSFPAAVWDTAIPVCVGDEAWAIGNPFLLSCDDVPSVSRGIISGTGRYQFPSDGFLEYTDCLQTDAAVNPGNSGGGLFASDGRLIGICGRCSFEKRGRVNVGIGYAIGVNQVANFLGDLRSGRILDHATLNATYAFDRAGRVVFTQIAPNSDLALQGVQRGDEIIAVAGQIVDSPNRLKNIVGTFPPTWRLPIAIRSRNTPNAAPRELRVRLAPIRSEVELLERTATLLKPRVVPTPIPSSPRPSIPPPPPRERETITTTNTTSQFYEERHGFANGYAQRQELSRVLTAWRERQPRSETWTLEGEVAGEKFRFDVDATGVTYTLPAERGHWALGDSRSVPRGSGGLFAALALVHKLATSSSLDFGEVVYLGTAPATGDLNTLYDLVAVTWDVSTARLYFSGDELVLVEFWSDTTPSLPAEIIFSRDAMNVSRGETLFATFTFAANEGESHTKARRHEEETKTTNANPILAAALERVVKVYGSGKLVGQHGYQSGFFISEDGDVLTAWSPVLENDPVTIVTTSGARYTAICDRVSLEASLAVLKISDAPPTRFPYFTLDPVSGALAYASRSYSSDAVCSGSEVFALSNVFNIAEGNEAVTAQRGTIAARTSLLMRRGAFASPYRGELFVLDFTTNNPGAAGGALIDCESGALLGVLGKELRDAQTHTWLNYAIPTNEVVAAIASAVPPRDVTLPENRERIILPSDAEKFLKPFGITLVPNVAPRTPAFIDHVRSGSDAEKAGLRSDDLIVRVGETLTPSIVAVHRAIVDAVNTQNNPNVVFTIERDGELIRTRSVSE